MHPSSRYSNIDQKQENSPSEVENQMVIYQGRSVTVIPTLLDRLAMMWGSIYEVQPESMLEKIPKSFIKMINQMDHLLDQMHNPPKQNLGLSSFLMRQTVEQEIAEEQEKEKTRGQIEEAFEGLIHQMGTQREQQLKLAKVSTLAEFREKQQKVMEYQSAAEQRYLENPVNVERRKEIDRQMIMAYKKGELSEKDAHVIESYWTYVTQDPQGQAEEKAIGVRAGKVFAESMVSLMDEAVDQMTQVIEQAVEGKGEKPKFKQAQFISGYINGFAQKTSQQWIQEREKCQTAGEKLIMDYYLLTEGSKMSAILSQMLRSTLQVKLEEANKRAESWMGYYRNLSHDLIEYHQEAIERAEKHIIEDKERFESEESQLLREGFLKIIKNNEEGIEDYKKTIDHEKKQTEKDFRKQAYAEMEKWGQENPREIRALIPEETRFEGLMQEIIHIEAGMQVDLAVKSPMVISATPDLQLDLQRLADPVEYFCQQIEMKDQHKLKLFSNE